MKHSWKTFLAILFFALSMQIGLTQPVQAAETIDLADTSWALLGKANVAITKGGSEKVEGLMYLNFGSNGNVEMEDIEGYSIYGTYDFDDKGNPVITIEPENVEDFILDNIDDLAGFGVSDYLDNLKASAVKTKITIKAKKGLLHLGYSMSFSVTFSVDGDDGRTYHFKLTYNVSAIGEQSEAAQNNVGQIWNLQSDASFKAKTLKSKWSTDMVLVTGPSDEYFLDDHEFELYDGDGTNAALIFSGRYIQLGSKILFFSDDDQLMDVMSDIAWNLLDEIEHDVNSLNIFYIDGKFTGKLGKGDTIKISGKVTFWADVVSNNFSDYGEARGSFSLKSTGELDAD